MVSSVLSRKWEVHCNRGNLNNLIGVPLTIFEVKAHHQIVVLEMGMNCPGELARLAEISRPHVVVLTNVAAAHLEGLGSFDEVVRAKSEIFSGLRDEGYIIYNADDLRLAEHHQTEIFHHLSAGTFHAPYQREAPDLQAGQQQ